MVFGCRCQAVEWGSWGNFDAHQLQLDARRHGIQHELADLPAHVNEKNWWADRGIDDHARLRASSLDPILRIMYIM